MNCCTKTTLVTEALLKIDTGAKVTAISEKLYKSIRPPKLHYRNQIMDQPGQHPIVMDKNSLLQQIFVIKDLKSNLLGLS